MQKGHPASELQRAKASYYATFKRARTRRGTFIRGVYENTGIAGTTEAFTGKAGNTATGMRMPAPCPHCPDCGEVMHPVFDEMEQAYDDMEKERFNKAVRKEAIKIIKQALANLKGGDK